MLHREIDAGKLLPLASPPILTGHRYFLATPLGRKRAPATKELLAFLNRA